MGFFEPMAERAGFAAEPAVSFAAEEAAPALGAFFAGVMDFVGPGAALPGAVFVGVDLSFKAGALPGPTLLLIFLGAAFLGGSLSTIVIFDTPSVDRCQLAIRTSSWITQSTMAIMAAIFSFANVPESSFGTVSFFKELTIDQRPSLRAPNNRRRHTF